MVHHPGEERLTLKRYDRAYFDRWYRGGAAAPLPELRRRVEMVVAITEHLLERPVRDVLDVGCGEGRWWSALRKLRPKIRYTGVDSSEYVVERYGRSRNILLGAVGELDRLPLEEEYDLVICADVLHYVSASEVVRGVGRIAELVHGLAYLEVFSSEDAFSGDRRDWQRRTAGWYRRTFAAAGLLSCGMHCWVSQPMFDSLTALERGP